MRFLFPVLLLATAASGDAAQRPLLANSDCPKATSHIADKGGPRSDPRKPQRLAELPPANTFAAVYKLDERGCMVPVMYRGVRSRRR